METDLNRPNKDTGANSRPASQFESRELRRYALVIESHRRYHGGAAVAQFWRCPPVAGFEVEWQVGPALLRLRGEAGVVIVPFVDDHGGGSLHQDPLP